MTTYLYLSPHFDDAALSCGGLLLRHAERGEAATVLTICAGTPDYNNLSTFARVQHRQWGQPRDPLATRRAEDAEAIKRLAAKAQYLDVPDCIYRRDAKERPVVFSNRSLFGQVHPDERPLVERIAREVRARIPRKREARIVAPLAAGHHIDHQLVRDAARRLLAQGYHVAWYEDFPYAEKRGAVTRARKVFGAGTWSCAEFAIDIDHTIYAIAAYTSQLKSTFKNERDMMRRAQTYKHLVANGNGFAERVWSVS